MKQALSLIKNHVKNNGFFNFIREQGLVGLAVAFILGQAITRVVQAFVNDIINPLLGLALGTAGSLKDAKFHFFSATIAWGDFVNTSIDFLTIALVVYLGVKLLKADRLDKKKE